MRDPNAKTETNYALIEEMKDKQQFKAASPISESSVRDLSPEELRAMFAKDVEKFEVSRNAFSCEAMLKLAIVRGFLYTIQEMVDDGAPREELLEVIERALVDTAQHKPCKDE